MDDETVSEPVYVARVDLPMRVDKPDVELEETVDALQDAITEWEDVVADRGRIIQRHAETLRTIEKLAERLDVIMASDGGIDHACTGLCDLVCRIADELRAVGR